MPSWRELRLAAEGGVALFELCFSMSASMEMLVGTRSDERGVRKYADSPVGAGTTDEVSVADERGVVLRDRDRRSRGCDLGFLLFAACGGGMASALERDLGHVFYLR